MKILYTIFNDLIWIKYLKKIESVCLSTASGRLGAACICSTRIQFLNIFLSWHNNFLFEFPGLGQRGFGRMMRFEFLPWISLDLSYKWLQCSGEVFCNTRGLDWAWTLVSFDYIMIMTMIDYIMIMRMIDYIHSNNNGDWLHTF